MCLLLVAVGFPPGYRLVLAANRDEYFDRPTAPAAFWPEAPHLLAGRDLKAGGTWLGITHGGRLAAVTNYRDPASHKARAPSRGELPLRFLTGVARAADFMAALQPTADRYNGFNLVAGDDRALFWFSNRAAKLQKLSRGVHGISNHLLDTPWPKVEKSKAAFGALLRRDKMPPSESFFRLLNDRGPADPADLPDTGVGDQWERILSPIFITSPTYGTRSSTLIFIDADGRISFLERTYDPPSGKDEKTVRFDFQIAAG